MSFSKYALPIKLIAFIYSLSYFFTMWFILESKICSLKTSRRHPKASQRAYLYLWWKSMNKENMQLTRLARREEHFKLLLRNRHPSPLRIIKTIILLSTSNTKCDTQVGQIIHIPKLGSRHLNISTSKKNAYHYRKEGKYCNIRKIIY